MQSGTAAAPGRARSPLAEFMTLAWPTVLTMLSYTVMQFVDAIMVAQVGSDEVAAQGNGGVWAFVPLAFLFGALTVVNTYVSQAMGAERPQDVARYAWAGIWLALSSWVVVLVPFAFVLPLFFSAMGHTPRVTALETEYGQILVLGAVVTLVAKALSNVFFGIHRPGVITIAATLGNLANVALNYALIYGEAGLPSLGLPGVPGMPALGLAGAAYATVLGTAVEAVLPAALFLGGRMHAAYATRVAWRPDWRAMRDLLRVGTPAGLQSGSEIFAWAIFMSVLVGRFGTDALAAGWITLRYMHLAFMPAVGFSVATTSIVGRYIGAGKPDIAAARVRTALSVAAVYMGVCGIAMLVFRVPLLAFFAHGANTDAETAERIIAIGSGTMIAAAVFQVFDAFGIVLNGALRGAGDTLWPSVVTIALSWALIVGLGAAIAALAPGLGALGPWIAAAVYIAAFGGIMAVRWQRGAWRRIRLLGGVEAAAAQVAPQDAGVPDLQPNLGGEDLAAGFQRARE